jgi:hypothetical protein
VAAGNENVSVHHSYFKVPQLTTFTARDCPDFSWLCPQRHHCRCY